MKVKAKYGAHTVTVNVGGSEYEIVTVEGVRCTDCDATVVLESVNRPENWEVWVGNRRLTIRAVKLVLLDRDVNAARNILARGMASLGADP